MLRHTSSVIVLFFCCFTVLAQEQAFSNAEQKIAPLNIKWTFWVLIVLSFAFITFVSVYFNNRQKRQLDKRNNQLKEALKEAKKSNELKNQFIRKISHEIRTPMNGVLGYAELLRKQDVSKEEQQEYVNTIIDSGKELVGVIENILEISSLQTEKNESQLKETNVIEAFEEVISLFKERAAKKNIDLIFKKANSNEIYLVLMDKSKFMRIITNILDNAVKFTEKGSVELDYKISNNNLNISIRDTGVGIEEDKKEEIFNAFSSVENVNSETLNGGIGLGLTIAKENASIINGNISFESKINQGTTFFVSLPIKKVEKRTVEEKENPLNQNRKYKILVAEDEEINFMLVNSILSRSVAYDFSIMRAMNGKEAVEICKKTDDINLVLMDIRMPIMDGYEATRIIKEMRPSLPIIAHTAYSADSDIQKALTVGCSTVLTKPVNLNEFNKVIDDHISMVQ